MLQRISSWLFLFGAIAVGIYTVLHFNFDPAPIATHFLFPYYAICVVMQYIWPEQPNKFERGELLNDLIHNAALVGITSFQTFFVHSLVAMTGAGLLFKYGALPDAYAAHNLPMWGQVVIAYLTFDFMFYVTHRMAHDIDALWRLHSVHHCAHRLSVLNASRAHPVDLIWRRLLPIFVTFQTGVSPEAFVMSGMIGSVLATITHMNVAFSFGPLNYIIGTNEIHRWHHSDKLEEAKNFSIFMLWDRLFGTYVYPADRPRPDRLGLFNENHYPLHNYLGQLLVPLKWKQIKARQAQVAQPATTRAAH
ncbi:MAG: sterol desaturase family protein [Aquabacterium sp.]|nr:sterol desaturase family protein [Aquabacterium sp.]